MDFEIRITPAAIAEFEEILEYSWTKFPGTAERFGQDLLTHIELLRHYPRIGAPVPRRRAVRKLLHTPVRVYYRLHEEEKIVEIFHFWHGSRRDPIL